MMEKTKTKTCSQVATCVSSNLQPLKLKVPATSLGTGDTKSNNAERDSACNK